MLTHRASVLTRVVLATAALSTAFAQTHATSSRRDHFRAIPRILVGKEWDTLVVLFNPGPAPVGFQQTFFADRKPVSLSIRSEALALDLTAPAIQGVIAPGAKVTLQLGSSAGDVQEVWSLLSYGDGALDGYTVVRRRAQGGAFSFETTLPLSGTQDVSTYIPFDNTQGFRSQLTLVNPASDVSTRVRLTYLGPAGSTLLIDSIFLAPAEQLTLALPDIYPDLANKSGTVLVESDTDRLAIVGLRQNVNYGVISALPAIAGPALK